MFAFDPHANFIKSLVAVAPSPATTGLTLSLTAGDVAALAAPTTGSFNAVVWPTATQPTAANAEIVRCTFVSGDQYAITRHQEGSITRSIAVGDQIQLSDTTKIFTDIETAVNFRGPGMIMA